MADLSVTAANVLSLSGELKRGFAGATLTAGQAVYASAPDVYSPASKTSALLANAIGIAMNGAAAGQPVVVQKTGTYVPGATLDPGMIYVVGTTGGIRPISDVAAADYVGVLGGAYSASVFQLNPFCLGVVSASNVT